MKAEFRGGPYDGITLDHNDLNLYGEIAHFGYRSFVLLPPRDQWDAIKRGELESPPPPEYPYERIRTQGGVYFQYAGDGAFEDAFTNQDQIPPGYSVVKSDDTYFRCMRGDASYVVLERAGHFPMEDEKGRTWVCHEVSAEVAQNSRVFEGIEDMMEAQGELRDKGLSEKGTECCIFACSSRDELLRKLSDVID